MKQLIGMCVALMGFLCFSTDYFPGYAAVGEAHGNSEAPFYKTMNLELHGNLRNELAYRISDPTKFTKIRNQLLLSESSTLTETMKFKISGRAYYDAVYAWTDTYSENVENDQEQLYELRDTYLDYSKGPFDIRVGKQQIVWGEAVGLFYADVVNAKDLREFILPQFDLIRIPQWGTDMEYVKGNCHLEFVWLPVLEFNKYGVAGSEFAFPYPVPDNTAFTTQDPLKPKNTFSHNEVGSRISYLVNGWDVSVFDFYTYDKKPVMYRTINAGVYEFSPQYKRQNIIGSTFSKEIRDVVVKGEFVYNPKSYFSIIDPASPTGIVRKNFLDYLLGMDYTLFGSILTNVQFMQRLIFDYDNRLANQKRVNNSISFWAKKSFMNNNLDLECLLITSLMEQDLLARPKLTYKLRNNWKFIFGVDLFSGDSAGIFGEFKKRDRVYTEASYAF